ncbi:hypothetical protein IQ270_03245 [Microcoleus sp. LEGE 07076]|uniref:hypothetical protein n=1 Tax=Microcoleus sp. LEGE 07076 TaxID=915322 RepID=UPI0018825C41|nr:hypothetical protein [Microcoleus sp. LEGE 07076]MBE9183766.1 hypothetical protein [Microcoleus sp. LEGE 07076]
MSLFVCVLYVYGTQILCDIMSVRSIVIPVAAASRSMCNKNDKSCKPAPAQDVTCDRLSRDVRSTFPRSGYILNSSGLC